MGWSVGRVAWHRRASGREIAGIVVLGVLIGAGVGVQAALPQDLPTAEESYRIGWADPTDTDELAHDLYARINDERDTRGSGRLAWDEDLAATARDWSEHMIATGQFEHSPGEFRHHPRYPGGTGENIALEPGTTADAHVGLMRSDGHRDAILEPAYDAVGVGVVCRNDGVMWVTQVFGRSQPIPPPADRADGLDLGEEPITRQHSGIACP